MEEKKWSHDKTEAMESAREVLRSIYSPATDAASTVDFLERFELMRLFEDKMGNGVLQVNLAELMKEEGYLVKLIRNRPYWHAIPVV